MQTELAVAMGKSQSTVADYLRLDRRVSFDLVEEIADGINRLCAERGFPQRYTAASLQQGSEPANAAPETARDDTADLRAELAELRRLVVRDRQGIDFYGPAPCGTPLYIEDADVEPAQLELDDVIDEPMIPGRHYVLQASGDSMEPAVCDGDWIVVDRQRQPQMNEIVAANLNGGLTIKRVVPDRATGRPSLMPDNDRHQPIALDDGDELQMLGVVVGVLRQYIRLVGPDPIARAQQTRRRRKR